MSKKLYLIPTTLSDEAFNSLSIQVAQSIAEINHFMVENERAARPFIKKLQPTRDIRSITFFELNEHTNMNEAENFFLSVKDQSIGIISEAGCPAVADPGAEIVMLAHENGVEVIPLVGPSSILLALMSSGLNGQRFAFNGYLPKDEKERQRAIKILEQRSFSENQSQLFMETPYRQQNVFEDILQVCAPSTYLSIAIDLTGPEQYIRTKTIAQWRQQVPDIHKKPGIFVLYVSRK